MAKTNIGYLITRKHYFSSFFLAADRQYFSGPVLVELLHSEVSTTLLYVRDPYRGDIYPTLPQNVVAEWRLTNKQRREVA